MSKNSLTVGFVLDDTLDVTDGVQQNVMTLGKWLTAQGHYVHYIVAQTKRDDLQNIHSITSFVKTRFNQNNVRTPKPARKQEIKKVFEHIKFDVLHVQMPYSPLLAGRVMSLASKKTTLVGTFHILPASKLSHHANKILALCLRRTLKLFDATIAVSVPSAKFAEKVYGIKPSVVYNPVNFDSFVAARLEYRDTVTSSESDAHSKHKVRLVFLGRLVERKGIIQLINAYKSLDKETISRSELIICGDGPLRTDCENLGMGYPIVFKGKVSEKEKARQLSMADIAVFPSTGGESFGIVLVEAMAAGSGCVIAGDNPGYRSVFDGCEDALFDANNDSLFAATLKKYITDAVLRAELFTRQQLLAPRYSIDAVGPQVETIYRNAMKRNKGV
jgi:phosphatidylinositol alpha-mannosyltransferase